MTIIRTKLGLVATLCSAAAILALVVHQGASSLRPELQPGSDFHTSPEKEIERKGETRESSQGEARAEDVEFRILCSGSQDQTLRQPDYLVQLANHGARPLIAPFGAHLLKKGMAWFELTDDRGKTIEVEVESLFPAAPEAPDTSDTLIPSHAGHVQNFGSRTLREQIVLPEIRSIRFVYAAAEARGYQELTHHTLRGDLLPPVRFYSQMHHLVALK